MATASAPTELYFREFKKAKELASKLAGEASRSIQIKPFPGKNNGFSVIVPAAITSQFLGVVGAAAEGLINQRVNIGLFSATILMLMDSGRGFESIAQDSLVIEAFRRSDNQLADASIADISEYFSEYSLEAQQGIINNVKGIYHELAFVQQENADGDQWFAELMPSTNHPGVDVVLTNLETSETIDLQLKATDSLSYIQSSLASLPAETQLLATQEIANKVEGVESSGLSNADLNAEVTEVTSSLTDGADTAVADTFLESLLPVSAAVATIGALDSYAKGEEVDSEKVMEDISQLMVRGVLISLGLSFF